MYITKNQFEELDLLINDSLHIAISGDEGYAEVSNQIQKHLGCDFKNAVKVLDSFMDEIK